MSPPFRPFVIALTVLLVLTATAAARATDLPVLIVTRGAGAEDCPTAAQLAELVSALGQRQVATATDRPSALVLHVSIERNLAGYSAVLNARGTQQGTRTLSDVSSTCQSLAEALAVVIAVVLDAAPTATPAPTQAPPPDVRAPGVQRPPPRWGLEAFAGVGVALLNDPLAVGGGGATLRLSKRFELALGGVRAQRDTLPSAPGEIRLELTFGYLRGCGVLVTNTAATLELCAMPALGALRGAGFGFDSQDAKTLPWTAIGFGPAGRGTLGGGTSFWIGAYALAPLVRQGFAVSTGGTQREAFTVDPLGLMLSMGVRWER